MGYSLNITDAAEHQLDNLVQYLLFELQTPSAASHLMDEIQKIYLRLEDNPYQFPVSSNPHLKIKEYREAIVNNMSYVVIFRIDNECIYVIGIFHQLENYINYL